MPNKKDNLNRLSGISNKSGNVLGDSKKPPFISVIAGAQMIMGIFFFCIGLLFTLSAVVDYTHDEFFVGLLIGVPSLFLGILSFVSGFLLLRKSNIGRYLTGILLYVGSTVIVALIFIVLAIFLGTNILHTVYMRLAYATCGGVSLLCVWYLFQNKRVASYFEGNQKSVASQVAFVVFSLLILSSSFRVFGIAQNNVDSKKHFFELFVKMAEMKEPKPGLSSDGAIHDGQNGLSRYVNSRYGFEFSYPDDIVVVSDTDCCQGSMSANIMVYSKNSYPNAFTDMNYVSLQLYDDKQVPWHSYGWVEGRDGSGNEYVVNSGNNLIVSISPGKKSLNSEVYKTVVSTFGFTERGVVQ